MNTHRFYISNISEWNGLITFIRQCTRFCPCTRSLNLILYICIAELITLCWNSLHQTEGTNCFWLRESNCQCCSCWNCISSGVFVWSFCQPYFTAVISIKIFIFRCVILYRYLLICNSSCISFLCIWIDSGVNIISYIFCHRFNKRNNMLYPDFCFFIMIQIPEFMCLWLLERSFCFCIITKCSICILIDNCLNSIQISNCWNSCIIPAIQPIYNLISNLYVYSLFSINSSCIL